MKKYPLEIRKDMEHHYITQEMVDRLRDLLYNDPIFQPLAEDYARKQVAAVLREYGEERSPDEIEEFLERPISQTDLGCDKFYQWFNGLIAAHQAASGPYTVTWDRELVTKD